ncbi:MAG: hypothetical protein NZ521_09540, partial [Flammeovirgaceae bacterium]|nr:hypothetical protein [Flammeovirgaceae bacterium]MDW8288466.1 hypothetical protein [Flammeovirgaceae bacterium]
FSIVISCFLWSCTKSSKNETETGTNSSEETTASLITCEGIGEVKITMNEATMIEKFGKENVKRDSLYEEEGFAGFATILWQNTPKEVWVMWQDENFQKIRTLEVRRNDSIYRTSQGVRVGNSLNEVVAANGGIHIEFSGLGWDFGGWTQNFSNGTIGKELPCLSLQLDFSGNTEGMDISSISGDVGVKSDNPVLQQIPLKVVTLTISQKS